MSRRFSARILNKQKSADNKQQDSMVKAIQKKKKDLEMQPISKPLTPVAQAVTDKLYDEEKISKGGPVKMSSSKSTPKASRGNRKTQKKISQLILVLSKNKKACTTSNRENISFCHMHIYMLIHFFYLLLLCQ